MENLWRSRATMWACACVVAVLFMAGAMYQGDQEHAALLRCELREIESGRAASAEPWPARPLPPALQGKLYWYEKFGGERCYCGDIEVDCDGEDTCEPPS